MRRAPRAPRRAAPGALRRTGDDDGVAARVLVPVEPRPGIAAPATARAGWRRCGARSRPARARGCRCRRAEPRRTACDPAAAGGRASGERRSRCASPAPPGRRLVPVVPSRPLGTSTATTGLPQALMAATTSAATPSSGRDRPAPNRASTMRSASARVAGAERLDGRAPALRHRGGIALQRLAARPAARGAPGSPSRARAAPPRSRRRRCCRARRPPQSPPRAAPPARRQPRPRRGRRSPSASARARRVAPPARRRGPFQPPSARSWLAKGSPCSAEPCRSSASCSAATVAPTPGVQRGLLNAVILGNSPIRRQSAQLAPASGCPVDTQTLLCCAGICCRVNLGMPRA